MGKQLDTQRVRRQTVAMKRLALTLTALGAFASCCIAAAADTPLRLNARAGTLIGIERQGIREFLGIPYAAAPIGPLRWRAPQSARRLSLYRADRLPSPSPQNSANVFAQPSVSEDCLYLECVCAEAELGSRGTYAGHGLDPRRRTFQRVERRLRRESSGQRRPCHRRDAQLPFGGAGFLLPSRAQCAVPSD